MIFLEKLNAAQVLALRQSGGSDWCFLVSVVRYALATWAEQEGLSARRAQ